MRKKTLVVCPYCKGMFRKCGKSRFWGKHIPMTKCPYCKGKFGGAYGKVGQDKEQRKEKADHQG